MKLPALRLRLSTMFVLVTILAALIYANSRRHSPAIVGCYMPADPEPGPDWPVFGFHYGWPWSFLTEPEPAHHPGAENTFRHVWWRGAAADIAVGLGILGAGFIAWEGLLRLLRRRKA